ncbi:PREDICTED: histone deacetylase complex subunit SAP30L [Bison bison bison]|uniref:Histone deacetylase complex subunit SAP30L n=2 Tax=Boreoeutheria TaxID=1437010 RepID=A0A6P3GDT4_BISBB|nr:PREDICTED: histone deacetylase complex subunit SAP30L [Bison bison bison]
MCPTPKKYIEAGGNSERNSNFNGERCPPHKPHRVTVPLRLRPRLYFCPPKVILCPRSRVLRPAGTPLTIPPRARKVCGPSPGSSQAPGTGGDGAQWNVPAAAEAPPIEERLPMSSRRRDFRCPAEGGEGSELLWLEPAGALRTLWQPGPGVLGELLLPGTPSWTSPPKAFSKRVQKSISQKKLKLDIDKSVRHLYICDFHKNFIQSVRNKRKRKTSDDGGDSPEHDTDIPEVDLFQLQVNTLRRYKRHYKLQTRPGFNKAQLAETVSRHFRNIPVNEKETLAYFIYMVKSNKSRLDQKSESGKQLE